MGTALVVLTFLSGLRPRTRRLRSRLPTGRPRNRRLSRARARPYTPGRSSRSKNSRPGEAVLPRYTAALKQLDEAEIEAGVWHYLYGLTIEEHRNELHEIVSDFVDSLDSRIVSTESRQLQTPRLLRSPRN